jgi:hypothetical protein
MRFLMLLVLEVSVSFEIIELSLFFYSSSIDDVDYVCIHDALDSMGYCDSSETC